MQCVYVVVLDSLGVQYRYSHDSSLPEWIGPVQGYRITQSTITDISAKYCVHVSVTSQ